MYGYNGKILRVDLTNSKVSYEDLGEETARKYIGGTGLGMKYIFDEVPPEIKWSDEGNRVIMASGPLGATNIPGSGTVSLVTKAPMTNAAATTQANGYFGAFLRTSGFDGLVVQGKAPNWVYIHIHDDIAEIKDASHLAGKDTWETTKMIKEENGKKERSMSVACIGPAGENLVRYACTVVDGDHVASKSGNGAVLGSKLLKAIAVDRGKTHPPLFDKDGLNSIAKEFREDIDFAQFGNGTTTIFDGGGLALGGNCIMYNYNKLYDPNPELVEKLNKFGSVYIRETHNAKRDPCWACNATHCHKLTISEGPYKGEPANEPEYETILAFGPILGNFQADTAIYLSNYADRLGFDANEAGWTIGMAIECFENGVLTDKDTDGLKLAWGDYKVIEKLMEKIACRKGFGDLLAEGVMRASNTIGGKALDMAVYVKKGSTPRGVPFKRGWPGLFDYIVGQGGTNEGMDVILDPDAAGIECSIGDEYRGIDGDLDQTVEFNAKLGWGLHFNDCLSVCYFPTSSELGKLIPAIRAATGWDFSGEETEKVGKRVQNLLRSFNVRHGHTRAGDYPSPRMVSPVELPPSSSVHDLRPVYEEMLDRYYEGMGWDKKTTKPLPETLKNLDLDYVIPKLWGGE